MMSQKLSFLFSVPTLLLLMCSTAIAQECKRKTVSGLPHTFTGVARCNNDTEWSSEAQSRCRQAILTQFPSSGFEIREWYSPSYGGDSIVENKCKTRVAGACVDYYRECKAVFSQLNCSALVCRRSNW